MTSRAVLTVLLAAVVCLPWTMRPASADQEEDIAALVEYLRQQDTETVVQAVGVWWAEQEQYRQERQVRNIEANWQALARAEGDPVIGPDDGDVTLVEFFDYRCGFCKRVLGDVMALAKEDKRLRIVFKEFPILGETSVVAARASLAADRQGKWTEFHTALLSAPGALDENRIMETAAGLGLDMDMLRADMESEAVTAIIDRNRALAERLGVRGTPAFLVKNAIQPGAVGYDALVELVTGAREAG